MIIGNIFCDAEGCTNALGWSFESLLETYGALVEHIAGEGWSVVAAEPMQASRVICPACTAKGAMPTDKPNAGRCAEDRRNADAFFTLLRS